MSDSLIAAAAPTQLWARCSRPLLPAARQACHVAGLGGPAGGREMRIRPSARIRTGVAAVQRPRGRSVYISWARVRERTLASSSSAFETQRRSGQYPVVVLTEEARRVPSARSIQRPTVHTQRDVFRPRRTRRRGTRGSDRHRQHQIAGSVGRNNTLGTMKRRQFVGAHGYSKATFCVYTNPAPSLAKTCAPSSAPTTSFGL